MLLKQFALLSSAYTYGDSVKGSHTNLYVSFSNYHYQVIASDKIRKFQNVVYFWYNGTLQLDLSAIFPSTIYANKARFRFKTPPPFDGTVTPNIPNPTVSTQSIKSVTVTVSNPITVSRSITRVTSILVTVNLNSLPSITTT